MGVMGVMGDKERDVVERNTRRWAVRPPAANVAGGQHAWAVTEAPSTSSARLAHGRGNSWHYPWSRHVFVLCAQMQYARQHARQAVDHACVRGKMCMFHGTCLLRL
jgi:hypothetical protein